MTSRFLVVSLFCPLLWGCSELDNCPDESDEVVEITRCPDNDEACNQATGVYASADWRGPLDPFPAKTMMHFAHGLGSTPEVVTTYVSFSASDSDLTENAGNQGRIHCVDDTDIWIKNDTCEESFYIRVAASASGTKHAPCSCQQRRDDPASCPEP